ncbi:MAG: glycosyltransferase family A protein [Bacteroidales bacterium]|jgi:glycosyltransferase involved in cell wall biosynthesis|nr:glycosyltransferase family A protein [Bacteroidales bacterium]
MSFANTYFSRFQSLPQQISVPPSSELQISIVIPCFSEPEIIRTLDSLRACDKSASQVEILIVVNYAENVSDDVKKYNQRTYAELRNYSAQYSTKEMTLYPLFADDLPQKHAGVGLARKIGMDEAVHRFNNIDNPSGIIVACDADSLVQTNYLQEIRNWYHNHPQCAVACVYFEHPLSGDLPQYMYDAIAQYELHLRLYVEALKYMQVPYAYHTVGSCMTLTAHAYCKCGGMNKRQAGEDFYFLQKLFQAESVREGVGEINSTMVIPSSRVSYRVPFGTGHAMQEMMQTPEPLYYSYHPHSYEVLREFFKMIPSFYSANRMEVISLYKTFHPAIRSFVSEAIFCVKIDEIQSNASSDEAFAKRFFMWANAFFVFRFLNEAHISFFQKLPVSQATELFLCRPVNSVVDALHYVRKIQKKID